MAFQFPWTNLHELNLDWFLSKFKQFTNNYLGTTATVELVPTTEQPEVTVTGGTLDDDTDIVDPFTFNFKLPINTIGGGAVNSVNGMVGDVIVQGGGGGGDVLSVNGKTGAVVLDKTDIGLGNVDNVQQYSATNPPPYPVTSVNGDTGAVTIDKTDIGLGNVANETQYSANNPPPYPVTSVNGMTGAVTVSTSEQLYMRSVTIATSDWTAGSLTTASGNTYSYYYEVSITNMTQNDFVEVSNMGSESSYTGNFAIQGLTGKFRIWVATQPNSNIAWYVYYTVGMTAQT